MGCPYKTSGCRFKARNFSPGIWNGRLVFDERRHYFWLAISNMDKNQFLQTDSVINLENIPEKSLNTIMSYLDNLSIGSLNSTSFKLRKCVR